MSAHAQSKAKVADRQTGQEGLQFVQAFGPHRPYDESLLFISFGSLNEPTTNPSKEPLLALQNKTFVRLHPSCGKCSGWRSPGATGRQPKWNMIGQHNV